MTGVWNWQSNMAWLSREKREEGVSFVLVCVTSTHVSCRFEEILNNRVLRRLVGPVRLLFAPFVQHFLAMLEIDGDSALGSAIVDLTSGRTPSVSNDTTLVQLVQKV